MFVVLSIICLIGCNNIIIDTGDGESDVADDGLITEVVLGAEAGEESHGVGFYNKEGEESNVQYTKNDVLHERRGDTLLSLKFDANEEAFVGNVKNVNADSVIKNIRVEIHLSNGVELGLTNPVDLPPLEQIEVRLDAKGQVFDTWSAHAEFD